MNIAIYIENGRTQLVLTPENGFEKEVISKVEGGKQEVVIYTGNFYKCQGGWTKHGIYKKDTSSLIIVMNIKEDE